MGLMTSHAADRALEAPGSVSDRGEGERHQRPALGRMQNALP